jgi:Flp pilus assembly pilin Flp
MASVRVLSAGLARLAREEQGPTTSEYAVMLALVILAVMAAIAGLSSGMRDLFQSAQAAVEL